MSIAFFDLDKTLISVNSGRLWVGRELAMGRLSKRHAARALIWLAQYRLGLATIEGVVAEALLGLKGTAEHDIKARSDALYETRLRTLVRPGAKRALSEHRQRGDVCVLLTSSLNYVADRVGAELAFDAVLCNRMEVTDGLHTGRTVGPICFGAGKLTHARNEAQARHVSLGECCFYTDSFSDLSVMEAVGRPVAVNPDPRLRRRARHRGWEIADWGSP
jgi:HAD superfamily hydrolase (TIGR01490 family)